MAFITTDVTGGFLDVFGVCSSHYRRFRTFSHLLLHIKMAPAALLRCVLSRIQPQKSIEKLMKILINLNYGISCWLSLVNI